MLHRLDIADFMGSLEGLTSLQLSEVLDKAEKTPTVPGTLADQYRSAHIAALRAEILNRASN
jgi:hypothetical protein